MTDLEDHLFYQKAEIERYIWKLFNLSLPPSY